MKVAVVGSRGLGDACYTVLCQHIPTGCSEIISGGAVGIDTLAERYAAEAGLRLTVIRPDYHLFDRAAPLVRNGRIVREADYVLILWDGVSRGTRHVIMTCLKTGKPYKLLLIRGSDPEEIAL
ncbi:MAG: DUF2493 domain-containing protein [Oscillospiraceae bacterium]|nr:DUF2493 domain-containing protein [Oscillospiraceae bacterium]